VVFVALVGRHAAVRGVGALVPIYLLAELSVSPATMGLLLTVASLGQVICMPVVGRLADAGPLRRVVLAGFLASATYPWLLGGASVVGGPGGIATAVAGFLAIALGFSALDIGVIAVVGRVVPRDRESAFLGLRATAGGLGGVIGPTLVGAGVVAFGYVSTFAAAGVVVLLAAGLAATRLPEPPRIADDAPPLAPRIETAVGIPRPLGRSRPGPGPGISLGEQDDD
jgi:MFS family permease